MPHVTCNGTRAWSLALVDDVPACSASASLHVASGCLSTPATRCLVLGAQVHAQGNALFLLNYRGFQLHWAKSAGENGAFPLPSCSSVGT